MPPHTPERSLGCLSLSPSRLFESVQPAEDPQTSRAHLVAMEPCPCRWTCNVLQPYRVISVRLSVSAKTRQPESVRLPNSGATNTSAAFSWANSRGNSYSSSQSGPQKNTTRTLSSHPNFIPLTPSSLTPSSLTLYSHYTSAFLVLAAIEALQSPAPSIRVVLLLQWAILMNNACQNYLDMRLTRMAILIAI